MSLRTIKWVDGDTLETAAGAGNLVIITFSQRKIQVGQVGDALDCWLSLSENLRSI